MRRLLVRSLCLDCLQLSFQSIRLTLFRFECIYYHVKCYYYDLVYLLIRNFILFYSQYFFSILIHLPLVMELEMCYHFKDPLLSFKSQISLIIFLGQFLVNHQLANLKIKFLYWVEFFGNQISIAYFRSFDSISYFIVLVVFYLYQIKSTISFFIELNHNAWAIEVVLTPCFFFLSLNLSDWVYLKLTDFYQ